MLAPGIYRTAEILPNRPTSTAPPAQPQGANGSVTQQPEGPAPLTTLAISRGPAPLLGHIQPVPQLPQAFRSPLSAPLPPSAAGIRTRHPDAGCLHATAMGMLSAWAGALLPSPAGPGQAGGHPSTPNKMTNKRKQTKTEDSPLPRPQEGAEGGGVEGGRREQACSLGQIFCCFIRVSVNQLEFARTGVRGVRGGVSKRERAREELERTGIASCPGLHFAVIICTNSS